MSLDRFDPRQIEGKWYRHWTERNLFAPPAVPDRGGPVQPGSEPYSIVIPPPNVTGSLHMGHAWDNTLQDVLIRWRRMQGRPTLWVPGTDHAGIATQWMVERMLREQGTSKEQVGREEFLRRAWEFKEESHGTIVGQLKRLGVSCDWSRERFTLDPALSKAVRKVFVALYREGLIYRALRMVNWSPGLLSAISDLEVDHQTRQGQLWYFRYPLADGSGQVTVATTRPETMLGDTAVAVHPDDARYQALVGKRVRLPLAEREIPIVADAMVDPQFGTGAVKVTPGHDFNDFELGLRQKLPVITVMDERAHMNDQVPPRYRGLDRFEARKRVVEDLQANGLLEKVEPHQLTLGICSRSGAVVEPRVSLQWWVKMKPLAEPAIAAVEQGQIQLVPDFQKKIFFEWMKNIQDWCISRQLWWGHRIPVWYCRDCEGAGRESVIVPEADVEQVTACPACGSGRIEMEQDVLDTWFSSGLWPLTTMGWPEETADLKTFYPTSVLVTGYDILFFWVARMIVLGLKFRDQFLPQKLPVEQRVPFHQVLLHGLLRAADGQKMSKTKGNGVDPLEMIDKYGADALRFTLASGTVPGQDMVLQESVIEGHRNFINKIWNATKFYLLHVERLGEPQPLASVRLGQFDHWILWSLNETRLSVNELLQAHRYNEACQVLYAFAWHSLCDWYVEISKPLLYGEQGAEAQAAALATLAAVLEDTLKLLHPLMPFVTEELWHALPGARGPLMIERYPSQHPEMKAATQADQEAGIVIRMVETIRTVRSESGIAPRQKVNAVIKAPGIEKVLQQPQCLSVIQTLGGIAELRFDAQHAKQPVEAHGVGSGFEVFLDLAGQIDFGQERNRLTREKDKLLPEIEKRAAKLTNTAFIGKAPAAVVEKNREELAALQTQLIKLNQSLAQLPSS